jgi:hypothetical protein
LVIIKSLSKILIALIAVLLLHACIWVEPKTKEKPIARVGDAYLYFSDIKESIPKDINTEDSTILAGNLINNWVRQQVVIKIAEQNLPENAKNFESQLKDYRNSLLIYTYEDRLVQEKLDTIVSPIELEEYYKLNLENFRLNQDAFEIWYFKIPEDAPFQARIENLVSVNTLEARSELIDYCRQYALDYQFEEDYWLYEKDLLKLISQFEDESIFKKWKKQSFINVLVGNNIIFIGLVNSEKKGDFAPLPLIRETAESAILNKRKLDFLKEMRSDLYKAAVRKNEIEYFE